MRLRSYLGSHPGLSPWWGFKIDTVQGL